MAGAAFFAAGAVLLVTRPDLVFPRTTGAFSTTAGAYTMISDYEDQIGASTLTAAEVFLGLEVLALAFGFAAVAAFFGAALDAAAFLVAVFFGAALAVCQMSACRIDVTTAR